MDTTENISLGGYSFTIGTDAYNELGRYLDDIRTSFSGDTCADEITADIEERIAELLKEQCPDGRVASLNMIRDIEKRIGDPKMLAQEDTVQTASGADNGPEGPAEEETADTKTPKHPKMQTRDRRMYRDIDGRLIGGVCSGLGAYFNLDKVFFRIIFLILFFIGFIGIDDGPFCLIAICAYVCLWIAMPAARTVEEKCRMKGKPMDLEGFRSKENGFEKEVKEIASSPVGRTIGRAGKVFLGIILLSIGLSGLLASIFIPSVRVIIENDIENYISQWGPLLGDNLIAAQIAMDTTFWWLVLVMAGILFVWFLYNGIMLLFNLKSPAWKPGLVLFIAWMISLFIIAAWTLHLVSVCLPTLMV